MKNQKCWNIVFLWFLFVMNITAQNTDEVMSKLTGLLPAEVSREVDIYFGSQPSEEEIPVIIEVTTPEIFQKIETLGGKINTREGNLATVQLPKKSLVNVALLDDVVTIEYNKVYLQNDKARQQTGANLVYQGWNPLPRGYTGKGVIVGIIDAGIDFRHPEFRDPTNPATSRISAIWDQNNNGTFPEGFSYGTYWTKSHIEEELTENPPNRIKPGDFDELIPGHGTHVSGTAAGNHGLAPDVELVNVITNFSFNGIIDGVRFIRDYAKKQGKPCVVNLSLGASVTNHEGNTNMSLFIDNLINGTKGFSVVAAAGNNGSNHSHWGGFTINNDTAIMYTGVGGELLAYFRIPKEFGNDLQFSIGVDSAGFDITQLTFTEQTRFLGMTPWVNISSMANTSKWFYHDNGNPAGLAEIIVINNAGLPYYSFIVILTDYQTPPKWFEAPEEMDIYRFMFRGKGSFHGWLQSFASLVLPSPGQHGLPVDHFVPSDSQFGIDSPADAKNVIAVGAYVNRPDFESYNGGTYYLPPQQAEGELADFSSHGPTFDGRQKPDICAPGKHVISAYPTFRKNLPYPLQLFNPQHPGWMITDTILPSAAFSGTSMSSPVVAGCVALMLEAKPDLDHVTIKNLLTSTAKRDGFTEATGPTPNPYFGYGKVDIYAAIAAALGLSDVDNIKNEENILVFPNPASEFIMIQSKNENMLPGTKIRILDTFGNVVFEKTGVHNQEMISTNHFKSGLYVMEYTNQFQNVTKKIIITR